MIKSFKTLDFDAIRQANPLDGYCRNRGIVMDKQGTGQCPIHGETNGRAFSVKLYKGKWRWICRGKCISRYPRGGDVIDLEHALGGGTIRAAAERLSDGATSATHVVPVPDLLAEKVAVRGEQFHPEITKPGPSVLEAMSTSRAICMEALKIAVERGLLWLATLKTAPAWIVTDRTRRSYLARRLEGRVWDHLPSKPKAWLLRGSQGSWPLGIQEAEPFPAIAITEGGPDFLSAFAHVFASGVEDRVAPVCMSGASPSIPDDALGFFRGKRVRIFTHDDHAGYSAAKRWALQLRGIASKVDGYRFDGLTQADGRPVKDLNDVLRIDYDCWEQNRDIVESVMSFAWQGRN